MYLDFYSRVELSLLVLFTAALVLHLIPRFFNALMSDSLGIYKNGGLKVFYFEKKWIIISWFFSIISALFLMFF